MRNSRARRSPIGASLTRARGHLVADCGLVRKTQMNWNGRDSAGRSPDENPGELPYLMKAEEVAEFLRTSRKAIYAMAERGRLPGAIRLGRRLLVRRDDLLESLRRAPSSTSQEME